MRERSSCGQRLSKRAITQQRTKQSSRMPCHTSSTLVRDICSPHLSKAACGKCTQEVSKGYTHTEAGRAHRFGGWFRFGICRFTPTWSDCILVCANVPMSLKKSSIVQHQLGLVLLKGRRPQSGHKNPSRPASARQNALSTPLPDPLINPLLLHIYHSEFPLDRRTPATKSPPEAAQVVGVRSAAESDTAGVAVTRYTNSCTYNYSYVSLFTQRELYSKIWCGFECTSSSPLMAAIASSGTGKLRDNILKAYIWARSCTA